MPRLEDDISVGWQCLRFASMKTALTANVHNERAPRGRDPRHIFYLTEGETSIDTSLPFHCLRHKLLFSPRGLEAVETQPLCPYGMFSNQPRWAPCRSPSMADVVPSGEGAFVTLAVVEDFCECCGCPVALPLSTTNRNNPLNREW